MRDREKQKHRETESMCMPQMYVWRSEDNLLGLVLCSSVWALGFKLRSSAPEARP